MEKKLASASSQKRRSESLSSEEEAKPEQKHADWIKSLSDSIQNYSLEKASQSASSSLDSNSQAESSSDSSL